MLSSRADDKDDDEANPQCAKRREADEFLDVTDAAGDKKHSAREQPSCGFRPRLKAEHAAPVPRNIPVNSIHPA
jgi:hypothetical protein